MDLGIIGTIIVIVIVAIILRALRARFKWVDWIAYLIVIAAIVYNWIDGGFWMGLIAFFVSSFVVGIMFGLGKTTEVYKFGNTYTLECNKCGYGGLTVIDEHPDGVTTKCNRCGHISIWTLNR